MAWVRRQAAAGPIHACAAPTGTFGGPTGHIGDLWRCDPCGALWRIGRACPACEANGDMEHRGVHVVGLAWLPATWWQRLMHRRGGGQA